MIWDQWAHVVLPGNILSTVDVLKILKNVETEVNYVLSFKMISIYINFYTEIMLIPINQ